MNQRLIASTATLLLFGVATSVIADDRPSVKSTSEQAAALRAQVRKTLRETAKSTDSSAAARQLLEVFNDLDADTTIIREDRLQMQHILRGRLEKLADQIRKSAAATDTERSEQGSGLDQFVNVLLKRSLKPAAVQPPAVLAQRGNPAVAAGQRGFGQQLIGQQSGNQADSGQDLVELIEATIAPNTWDTNGGNGSIRYFRPLRVIVVRQSAEVHVQIGDLLPQLQN